MNRFLQEIEQRRWKSDLHFYYVYKKIRDEASSAHVKEMVQQRMDRLKGQWPHHQKEFEE